MAVSPDGKSVYVGLGYAVARFVRNPNTGAISQPAGGRRLHQRAGVRGGALCRRPCARFPEAHGLTVSPDGKSVYVASWLRRRVARLNRNPTTGAISQPAGAGRLHRRKRVAGMRRRSRPRLSRPGWRSAPTAKASTSPPYSATPWCASTETRPPGRSASPPGTAGASARRGRARAQTDTRSTERGRWWSAPTERTSTPPPMESDAVVRFNRNTTTGAIVQPASFTGCISESGAGDCVDGDGLNGARGLAMSRDGKSIYVGSAISQAVARIDRRTTGLLLEASRSRRGARCINEDGSGACADGHGLAGSFPWSVAVAPGGWRVYAATGASRWRASSGSPLSQEEGPRWSDAS